MNKNEIEKLYSLRWATSETLRNPKKAKELAEHNLKILNILLGDEPDKNKTPKPLKRADIVMIIGHTKSSSGAFSEHLGKYGMSEYKFNSLIAGYAKDYSKTRGYKLTLVFRDNIGRKGAGELASKIAGKDGIVLHLHFNSTKGASGAETLFDTREKDNKEFAKIVQTNMVTFLKTRNRGTKVRDTGRGAYNLEMVTSTGCLVEPFFAEDKNTAEFIYKNRRGYAKLLVDSCIEFFNSKGSNLG